MTVDDDRSEALANANQRATHWQCRCERIATAMTREGIIKMAHECALVIEDDFCRGSMSRDQRLLTLEKRIRRVISIASCGEAYWQD
jgi:hypothetical protein